MPRSIDGLRAVSGLERAWLVAGRLHPPFVIHLVVEAAEALDADRWCDAITRTGAAWPGLRVRLGGRLRSTRWIAEDRALPVEVAEGRWQGDGSHARLEEPLLPGPGARALLWPADGRAVFSAHHAITDGRGLLGFVDDVVRVLGGSAPRGAAGGPSTDADLARTVWHGPAPSISKATHRSPFDHPPEDRPGLTWRRRRLPLRGAVVARSVHAALAASGHDLAFGVPVDLRRHAPDLRSSANLTGVAHISPRHGQTIEDIRHELDAAIDGRAAAGHALQAHGLRGIPLWLMTAIARRGTRRTDRRVPTSAAITSLGRHDLRLDGQPLRLLLVPPGSEGLPLFMSLSGDADGIEVAAVSPRSWAGAHGEHLVAWLDRFATAFAEPR